MFYKWLENCQRRYAFIFAIFLMGFYLYVPTVSAATDFPAGMSLVAKDQKAASRGVNVRGLDITWLKLPDRLNAYGASGYDSEESIFTIYAASKSSYYCFAIDETGTIIIGDGYQHIGDFHDGIAEVDKYLPALKPGEFVTNVNKVVYGFIDKAGSEVIPLGKYDIRGEKSQEGLIMVEEKVDPGNQNPEGFRIGHIGYIDTSANLVIPMIYDDADYFYEGLAAVRDPKTGLYGFIDKTGTVIIPMQYDRVNPFSSGLSFVEKGETYGFIDQMGKMVLSVAQAQNAPLFSEGLAPIHIDDGGYGKTAYVDQEGKTVIKPMDCYGGPFYDGVAVVSWNPDESDKTGKWIYPPIYQVLIDKKGNALVPKGTYAITDNVQNGYVIAMKDPYGETMKFGVLNKDGKEVVPCKFSSITHIAKGYCVVTVGDSLRPPIGILKIPGYEEVSKEPPH